MARTGDVTDASTSSADEFGLAQLVARNAEQRPDEVAIESVETGRHTWLEVDETARRWASGLTALGVRPGDLVLMMLPTGLDAYVGRVAAAAAGVTLRRSR